MSPIWSTAKSTKVEPKNLNHEKAACERVKSVDFGYVECDPEQDLHITLPNDGIRFIFCAHSQRLKKIEIYDMKLCALRYGDVYFNSAQDRSRK